MNRHLPAFFILGFLIFAAQANASLFSVSDQEVIQAGKQAHQEILKKYPLWDNSEEKARIDRLGNNLSKFSGRPEIRYRFYLLDSKILNAFATPDGSIHVTRGLATQFKNDDELSFVLGHEITHVEKRHGKQQIEKSMETQAGGNLLLLLLGKKSPVARFGIQGGAYWLSMKYSRDFETEADEGGIQLLQEAGISPDYAVKSLQRLSDLSKTHPDLLTKYFGSHPMPEDRISHAKEYATQLDKEKNSN